MASLTMLSRTPVMPLKSKTQSLRIPVRQMKPIFYTHLTFCAKNSALVHLPKSSNFNSLLEDLAYGP